MDDPDNAQASRKTVFLLGAGASAGSNFHLPTMARLFVGHELNDELAAFLQRFYPNRLPDRYDLEELLAYLETARLREGVWKLSKRGYDSELLYTKVLSYVKKKLSIPAGHVCPAHLALFEQLQPMDTVLTLNYDLVADNALGAAEPDEPDDQYLPSRMGKLASLIGRVTLFRQTPPALMPPERRRGFYLKLHGSLDWVVCPTADCENHINWYIEESSDPDGVYEGRPCLKCGATLETFIVPPVAAKRIEERGRLAAIWRLAFDELVACDRLVIIGVSFSPSDHELRWLLRQSLMARAPESPEVFIVNTSPEDRQGTRAFLPQNITRVYERETMRHYTGAQEPTATS